MTELKSCPFCAGKAITHQLLSHHKKRWVMRHKKLSWCPLNMAMPEKYETESNLILAWNTRSGEN